ncbi:MAG: hypothetical protein WCK89_14175 [bacterium]
MFSWLEQDRTKRLLCLAVCAAACAAAICSLSWRMLNDTPILLYLSNLMVRQGAIPYRDFFDMNLPGSYWMFGLLIRTLGTSDSAVHVANVIVIAAISGLMYWAISKPCHWCATLGVGLGALRVFSGEWVFVLQRELFALIPIAGLMVIGLRDPLRAYLKAMVVGLLLAWLALIKPQLVLYGLPVIVLLGLECGSWRQRVQLFAVMGVCGALPLVACALWLVRNGAWDGFCEVVQYWSLYGQMAANYEFVSAGARFVHIMRGMLKMLLSPYSAVAAGALYAGWQSRALSRKEIALLGGFLLLTIAVPALSGQFWGYHRLPFFYLTLCVSGYLLLGRVWSMGVGLMLALFWIHFAGWRVWRETSVSSVVSLKHGVPDAFGRFLEKHLQPGDRVQPDDWACGALQGMLIADALPATRFPYTFYFRHHVSHPLIKKLRHEFTESLENQPPRYLLEATTVLMPKGLDTEQHIQPFETWRNSHYHVVEEGGHYRIWERNRLQDERE